MSHAALVISGSRGAMASRTVPPIRAVAERRVSE